MWDGIASGAGRRAAICILLARWTTRSFIPNSERATITRSACMGGRKATHFQSTTTTSVTPPPPHSTVYFPLDSPDLSPCPFVRPSFCQSRGDGAPTPIPYILVVPARSGRVQEEVPAVIHTYPKVKDRSRSLGKSTRR